MLDYPKAANRGLKRRDGIQEVYGVDIAYSRD